MPTRPGHKRPLPTASAIAAALLLACPATGGELAGFKGDRLKGSISCVHPNIIDDLIARIGNEEDYTFVARFYLQQGYCLEADIPTLLAKPMAYQTFATWNGFEAEIWETVLRFDRGDGTSETLKSFSIVFPREMEKSFNG